MEELAETTEQIPATNPFHTSEKREKGMAEAGQSKQALEDLKVWDGIFTHSSSFHTHSEWLAPLAEAESFCIYTLGLSLLQKKGQFVFNHKTSAVSSITSTVFLESGIWGWGWG